MANPYSILAVDAGAFLRGISLSLLFFMAGILI